MTDDERKRHDEAQALFVNDDELRRRINPKIGRDRFRALIRDLELRRGFPQKDASFDGRYWPKVLEWLNSENALGHPYIPGGVVDGPENFDQPPRRKPRPR
jgi:hypothetical protein